MASQRQIEANRRNGCLGGPSTDSGKQRSPLSSLKHVPNREGSRSQEPVIALAPRCLTDVIPSVHTKLNK
jgi:hypothetical protein